MLPLFSDIVTSKLFRENVTYEYKRGTVSYDKKRDGKTKGSREAIKRRYRNKGGCRGTKTIYQTDAKDQKRSEIKWPSLTLLCTSAGRQQALYAWSNR